eukprot:GHVP01008816.1.p1 GENE.GHVP01008816.1~~GHVP01008816.1.p1  ORF type:complete len:361 (+),score=62.54 GHVP01008816.1:783-1865(+)
MFETKSTVEEKLKSAISGNFNKENQKEEKETQIIFALSFDDLCEAWKEFLMTFHPKTGVLDVWNVEEKRAFSKLQTNSQSTLNYEDKETENTKDKKFEASCFVNGNRVEVSRKIFYVFLHPQRSIISRDYIHNRCFAIFELPNKRSIFLILSQIPQEFKIQFARTAILCPPVVKKILKNVQYQENENYIHFTSSRPTYCLCVIFLSRERSPELLVSSLGSSKPNLLIVEKFQEPFRFWDAIHPLFDIPVLWENSSDVKQEKSRSKWIDSLHFAPILDQTTISQKTGEEKMRRESIKKTMSNSATCIVFPALILRLPEVINVLLNSDFVISGLRVDRLSETEVTTKIKTSYKNFNCNTLNV